MRLTRRQAEFGVLEVEVDDFRKRMHLCDFELPNELGEALFEFMVWKEISIQQCT